MANWLRKLLPRQEKFFPLFNRHAEAIAEAAEQLKASLQRGGERSGGDLDRFVKEGGETAQTILDSIRGSFVTPFDRADIKEMTASMQGLLEEMQAVVRSKRNGATVDLGGFGDLIVECARELKRGIEQLEKVDKHADDLKKMRDKIGDLRGRMSEMRDEAMLKLFEHGADDPMAALAGTKLLERVGGVVERFESVADHIDDLVLDHV